MTMLSCAAAPCKSCPYRRDVPSGVWHRVEYEKLPLYDGEIIEQLLKDARAAFYCHQHDGQLCAGWIGCHGAQNLLAIRLQSVAGTKIDPNLWDFKSPVELFSSGHEACKHGKRGLRHRLSPEAERTINTLLRQRIRREG